MDIRKAVFAGSWYPRSAAACKAEIDRYLDQGIGRNRPERRWYGGIVPHAGWYFSGHLATAVINLLKEDRRPDVVVIFGMHLHTGAVHFMMPQGIWQTPLGELPVAEDLALYLQQRFTFQLETHQRFTPDNTIEVQLPIIKYLLDPMGVLGLGVPPGSQASAIGRAVAGWAAEFGKRLKVIGSTDLTHYGDNYNFSPHGEGPKAADWVKNQNDRRAIDAMLVMSPEQVLSEGRENRNICCPGAVAAALAAGRDMGAEQAFEVGYASSYDKSPGDSFVGYAGVVF